MLPAGKNIRLLLSSLLVAILVVVGAASVVLRPWRSAAFSYDIPYGTDLSHEPLLFDDVTNAAGINSNDSWSLNWVDYDQDGYPDLYLNRHSAFQLYRNLGSGHFEEVGHEVIRPLYPRRDRHGAAWADFDNDGDQDLIQLVGAEKGYGERANELYIQQSGVLVDKTEAQGIDYPFARGRNPLWVDYDLDGDLDVIITAYTRRVNLDMGKPTVFLQTDAGFTDAKETTQLPDLPNHAVVLGDLTGDGRLEYIADVSNEGTTEDKITFLRDFLFSKRSGLVIYEVKDGVFEDLTSDLLPWKMYMVFDLLVADFNNDLRADLYTSWRNDKYPSHLFYQTDTGLTDFLEKSGLPGWSGNGVAGDFDNDMDIDLLILHLPRPILCLNNGDGTFETLYNAGGITTTVESNFNQAFLRGAVADYDLDGALDVYIEGWGFPGHLYHNKGNDNHWLQIDLVGSKSNQDGIGTKVIVSAGGKKQIREQTGGVHFSVQDSKRLHFGLRQNDRADKVTVIWPSGIVQELEGVPADSILTVNEPAASQP